MKLLNELLYIEFNEAVQCGMNENYLRVAKSSGVKSFTFLDDPDDKRKVLIEYESLKPKYKDQVLLRFGNPYEHLAKEPIKKMVTKDLDAEKHYMQYKFDGKMLPIERVNEYTTAASWLNMLSKADANKKEIKRLLNLSILEFFVKVFEIITAENIALPCSYKRLRERMHQFKEEGYPCLIHKQFGNNNAKKVNTEVAEATLLEMIANNHQLDDVFVCVQYNRWAVDNNHEKITPSTVGNYRRKNLALVLPSREGYSAFNEKFIREVKGLKPQTPLSLVEHDDNELDFLYADGKNPFQRYVAIVVIDSCTGLVLGKSYKHYSDPNEDKAGVRPWQIHHAYLDAMYYIRSLTGSWHLPFEIKSDRWAHAQLIPFYNKIAKWVPAAAGNKHRGYIEPFFSSNHWKRTQKIVSNGNWSGNNMTAKFRGMNEDELKLNAKNRPQIGVEAEQQIENFFHLLRHMPDVKRIDMQGKSRENLFMEKWATLSDADKRPITDEQFLLTFGVENQNTNGICITNRGIEPQIQNVKYSYDLPESWMYNKLIGEKVKVLYDPFDLSRVLVTDEKNIRFIAHSATLAPRALKDAVPGSRHFLNTILDDKKQQVQDVVNARERRKQVADKPKFYDAEAILKGGVLVKEEKQLANQKYLEDFNTQHESFLDENNNFDEFFNQSKTA